MADLASDSAPEGIAAEHATERQNADGGASNPAWFSGFDVETQGYLQTKGWTHEQGAAELLKAYRSLERQYGLEKLSLPKDENDVEGWNRTYDRLGRPPRWEDYKIGTAGDGNVEYAEHMAQAFHRLGLSTRQAQAIAEESDKFVATLKDESDRQFALRSEVELDVVRAEWGRDADRRFAAAQRAGLAFGIERDTMERIERAIGTRNFLTLMARIGDGLTEDRSAGGGGSGFMTPEAAQARLNDLKADTGWVRRYLAGDVGARADYDRLISIVAAG